MMKCLHLRKIVNKQSVLSRASCKQSHTNTTHMHAYVYMYHMHAFLLSHTQADSVRSQRFRSLFSVIKEETLKQNA